MTMTARTFFRCLLGLVVIWWLPVAARAEARDEKARIEALIRAVENLKDAKFIRNGSSYDSRNAGKFLRGKWQAKDKEILTAEDFIGKIASVSSTSGKPYLIQFPDGREMKCADFLRQELKK